MRWQRPDKPCHQINRGIVCVPGQHYSVQDTRFEYWITELQSVLGTPFMYTTRMKSWCTMVWPTLPRLRCRPTCLTVANPLFTTSPLSTTTGYIPIHFSHLNTTITINFQDFWLWWHWTNLVWMCDRAFESKVRQLQHQCRGWTKFLLSGKLQWQSYWYLYPEIWWTSENQVCHPWLVHAYKMNYFFRTDTNCSLPCKRFVHKVTKSIEARTKDMYFLQGTTNHLKTVLVLRYHRQQRYKRVKEVYTYSWGYLFSDFGGTMGLFLGLSLWDLANKALDLLKQVLVAKKLI